MNITLIWNEKKIKVPKSGLVKFRHSGNKKGKLDFFLRDGADLKSITIRKNPAGEYYAVLLFERGYCHKKKFYEVGENQAIGLDFSPADFYINSDGSSGKDFGYIAQKQANIKKLTKLQNVWLESRKIPTTERKLESKLQGLNTTSQSAVTIGLKKKPKDLFQLIKSSESKT